MINAKNMLLVADLIEQNAEYFHLKYVLSPKSDEWFFDKVGGQAVVKLSCGTTACIAGFAYLAKNGYLPSLPISIEDTNSIYEDIVYEAAEFLGLSQDQASNLFYHSISFPEPEIGIDYDDGTAGSYYGKDFDSFPDAQAYASAAANKIRKMAELG